MTGVPLSRIIEISDNLFPFSLAENWDNCGVQIGDPSAIISSIAFALDPTPDTIHFASESLCNLLITHHPLLLDSIRTIRADDFTGRSVLDAARLGVAILSLHTNFDAAESGINDELAKRIGLQSVSTPEEANCARFGMLPVQTTVSGLAHQVANNLQIPVVRIICDKDKPLQKVFVASGSGMGYFQCAMELGADVIVTGDVRYHAAGLQYLRWTGYGASGQDPDQYRFRSPSHHGGSGYRDGAASHDLWPDLLAQRLSLRARHHRTLRYR